MCVVVVCKMRGFVNGRLVNNIKFCVRKSIYKRCEVVYNKVKGKDFPF